MVVIIFNFNFHRHRLRPKDRFKMNTESFVKMLLHGAKYPHCAVNGLFVQKKTKSKNNQNENGGSPAIQIVDCIPLFHINMTLLPMLELALHQVNLIL